MATTKKRTKAEKEERAKLMSEIVAKQMLLSPTINSSLIGNLHKDTSFGENDFGERIELDVKAATETMEKVSDKVKNGDLSNLEEMLTCQAYSLQTLFTTMASKASVTTNADHIELLSKIALKAQNQCRATIATLSEMKNPKRAMFVKQLNQANQMQVNNASDAESGIQKKNIKPANELLEKTNGERLDTRTTCETIGTNQVLETVGTISGSKDYEG